MWRQINEKLEFSLNCLFYFYITSIIVIEVAQRYLFSISSSWGEETAIYAYIWMTYVGCARRVRDRGHLRVDALPNRMGRTGNFLVYMLSDLCFLILAGVIIATSMQMVSANIRFHQTFIGADLPLWVATVAVPVGWTLIGVRVIERSVKTIRAYHAGLPIQAAPLAEE